MIKLIKKKIKEVQKVAYQNQQGSLVINNLLQQYKNFFNLQVLFTEYLGDGQSSFQFINFVNMVDKMPKFQTYCMICGDQVYTDILLWDVTNVYNLIMPISDKKLDPNIAYLFGININGYIIDVNNSTQFIRGGK